MSGRIVHFEIPFDDAGRAHAFYEQAFGWSLTHLPEMNYTMVSTGPVSDQGMPIEPGFINGGMLDRSYNGGSGPTVVIDVDDLDAAIARVEELGGKVAVPRTQVGDMGWSAYVNDTEGNLMGLWQSAPQG